MANELNLIDLGEVNEDTTTVAVATGKFEIVVDESGSLL